MGRWEPDARGRLQRAALDLYAERGFEETTVQEIADRAGVTERTFFRHFADKREVLFDGSHQLEQAVVGGVREAEPSVGPIAAAVGALRLGAEFFDGRREWSTKRAAVIDANPSLQERELLKLSSMSAAVAAALIERGVTSDEAALVADLAIAIFHRTFQRWIAADDGSGYGACLDATLADFAAVTQASVSRA